MNNTDRDEQQALLPCPFCGVVPVRRDNVYQYGSIAEHPEGTHCPIENTTIGIKSWNMRSRASVAAVEGDAQQEFLAASVAVWREIDQLSALPEGYKGLPPETDSRKRELAAWEKYRTILDSAAASSSLPAEPPLWTQGNRERAIRLLRELRETTDPEEIQRQKDSWAQLESYFNDDNIPAPPAQPEGEQESCCICEKKHALAVCMACWQGMTDRFVKAVQATPPDTPVVAREAYSELIHIAAELVKGEGFLSPCADDHSARTPRGVIAAAQYQDNALKEWANRIRQVADRLSAATTSPSETAEKLWSALHGNTTPETAVGEDRYRAGLLHAARICRDKADSLRLGAEDGIAPAYAEDIELCERLAIVIASTHPPATASGSVAGGDEGETTLAWTADEVHACWVDPDCDKRVKMVFETPEEASAFVQAFAALRSGKGEGK